MKLSAETKAELQVLDCEYGGGIFTSGIRTDVIDKPILVLGLGGTGAESLIRVKHAIEKHIKLDGASGAHGLGKPHQIEYMAIDSDDNMQNLRYNGTSFANDEFLLLETSNLTSIYKSKDTVFRESIEGWIADNLRLQQVKHGAGGIRQAGRLLLTINANRIISLLTEKINRLTTNRNTNDLLYVFIAAGCAGGTGSGIFIDIPYIVQEIANKKGFQTENISMIFLPDVTLSDHTIDGSAAITIKTNGFAALKELDYLMNIERNGERFRQTYGDLSIDSNQPPYDLCHLISAKDEHGKLATGAKNYCMNVAAETIINFIASEEVMDGQSYTISSYLSNIENNKSAFIMTHQQKQPVNYIYNIVGASSAVLPLGQLLNYLTSKMFAELDSLRNNRPTHNESMQLLETFKLDYPALERALNQEKPPARNFQQYDYNVLYERPDIIDDAIKKELKKLEDHYSRISEGILETFRSTLQSPENAIYQLFTDLSAGPFYSLSTLSDLTESSVVSTIDNIRKRDLQQKRYNRDQLSVLEINLNTSIDKFKRKASLFTNKKSQANNIIESSENYLRLMSRNLMCDAMDRIYSQVLIELQKFSTNIIDTQCELILALRELFVKFDATAPAPASFSWDIEDTAVFFSAFEKHQEMAKDIDYKLSLKRLLQDITYSPGWMPGVGNTIVSNLNNFVAHQFQDVVHKSLDFYCELMSNENDVSLGDYINDKLNKLNQNAKVMFPMNHIPKGLHITFPPYAYLSVPANSPKVRDAIQRLGSKVPSIKYSRMQNRLYILNLKIAVALYCYKELNDYEAVYENSLSKIAGVHLYESHTCNWKNLPSPNYDRLWTSEYTNLRERAKNEELRRIFDHALERGIITFDSRTRRMVATFGEYVDTLQMFAELETSIVERTLSATQARAAINELDAILANPNRKKHKIDFFDTEFLPGTSEPDHEYAQGVFIYMPELNSQVTQELELHMHIARLRSALLRIDMNEIKFSQFAELLYMGAITKNRKNFQYVLENEIYTLHTMQDSTEKYLDYDIFQSYLDLDDSVAQKLQKRVQDEASNCTDEQFNYILHSLSSYVKDYTAKVAALDDNFTSERDGALKRLYYKTMLNIFKQEQRVLS